MNTLLTVLSAFRRYYRFGLFRSSLVVTFRGFLIIQHYKVNGLSNWCWTLSLFSMGCQISNGLHVHYFFSVCWYCQLHFSASRVCLSVKQGRTSWQTVLFVCCNKLIIPLRGVHIDYCIERYWLFRNLGLDCEQIVLLERKFGSLRQWWLVNYFCDKEASGGCSFVAWPATIF